MAFRAKPTLVLVEDDDVDAMLLERAIGRAELPCKVERVHDGREALDLMRGLAPEGRTLSPPFLMLLDINMPRMSGLELLEALRRDASLRGVPCFMLTTSRRREDIKAAYEHQIAGYFVKEDAGDDFAALVRFLREYLALVHLA